MGRYTNLSTFTYASHTATTCTQTLSTLWVNVECRPVMAQRLSPRIHRQQINSNKPWIVETYAAHRQLQVLNMCLSIIHCCYTTCTYIFYCINRWTLQGFITHNVKQTRNKSNDYFESMQYRQDVRHIAPYHKRKHFPSCTCCSENHNNMCAGNRKIRGLKFQYSVLAPSGGV